ncbi:MAG: AsmA family protein, partial [Burkholderiaceae bacterium]
NVILTSMAGDKRIKLNCMATDFGVTNGTMQTRSFIIDTDDAILDVSGTINLAQEQLDLTIKPKSKGLRVFSLRAPIYVRGNFKQPSVSIDKGVMAMRVGGAIALAALAPIAVLIPLVNAGPQENRECAALLAVARTKPIAPQPDKSYVKKNSAK